LGRAWQNEPATTAHRLKEAAMDETCRQPSRWGLLALPFLVLLMVPLAVLMALAFYLRALVMGLVQILGWLVGKPSAPTVQTLQGPHFSEAARRVGPGEGEHSVL
jgi:hypothetical protein